MNNSKQRVYGRKILSSQSFYLVLIIIALGIVTAIVNPKFLSVGNVRGVLGQIATLGLISAGVTVLIISGNFDISIGAIIGFAGTMLCLALDKGAPEWLAVLVGIGVSVGCATLNGVLAVLFKAPTMIITLATTSIYSGVCLTIVGGGNVNVFDKMEWFASTHLFGVIPMVFVVCAIGCIAIAIVLKYTQFGRRAFAIGNNPQAAYLAGIKVEQSKVKFFALSGIMTGIGVVMMVSRLGAFQASTGAGMELQAIGAVIIGGAPINGGKGNMMGTFFGVLLTGLIFNSLNLMRVSPYIQSIAFGALVIFSIAISSIRLKMEK